MAQARIAATPHFPKGEDNKVPTTRIFAAKIDVAKVHAPFPAPAMLSNFRRSKAMPSPAR
jgi:hypothetical protein